jgi:hypothetical protein
VLDLIVVICGLRCSRPSSALRTASPGAAASGRRTPIAELKVDMEQEARMRIMRYEPCLITESRSLLSRRAQRNREMRDALSALKSVTALNVSRGRGTVQ